ncbi:MAG: Ig-like domain-containing protein [bacterium]
MLGTRSLHKSCLLLLTLLACAKQGFPPGGPEDKTPPEVISSFPPPGATGVDVRTAVSIGFSEWMEKRSLKESIFISPIPKPPPKIMVKTKSVQIDLVGGLDFDQTYVFTVGTGAKDLHGNRLKSSWTFAFSTGDLIDSGRISGRIIWREGEVEGAYAWAYVLKDVPGPDPATDPPDYITQADGSGFYSFAYLSPGRYRLFAFVDRDGEAKYTVGQDPLGVPTGDVVLTPGQLDAGNRDFILAVRDTTRPECVSVVAADRVHVDLRFSEPIDPESIGTVHITSSGGDVEVDLKIRARHLDQADEALCHLVTDPQRPAGEYRVDFCQIVDLAGNCVAPGPCVLSFIGSAGPDTVPPMVVATSPPDSAQDVDPDLKIVWALSEALDTTGLSDAFHLTAIGGEDVSGTIEWPDPATLVFVPYEKLRGRSDFLAVLDTTLVRDVAGNRLSGVGTVLFFTTLNPDTLGQISGAVGDEESLARGRLFVKAEKVGDPHRLFETALSEPGPFELQNLLPGWYSVWTFRDEDSNGRFSYGRSSPISFAEWFTWYPDTVEVRSRWETQAVDMILRRP